MDLKKLTRLGVSEEVAQKILSLVEEETKAEKLKLENEQSKVETLKTQIKSMEDNLQTFKAAADKNETLQKQIADLEESNKKAKETYEMASKKAKSDFEAQINALKIENAVAIALKDAKARNITAAKALLNLKDAKISEAGEVIGLKEQLEALKTNKETSFLFDNAKEGMFSFNMNPEQSSPSNSGSFGAAFAQQYNQQFTKGE